MQEAKIDEMQLIRDHSDYDAIERGLRARAERTIAHIRSECGDDSVIEVGDAIVEELKLSGLNYIRVCVPVKVSDEVKVVGE